MGMGRAIRKMNARYPVPLIAWEKLLCFPVQVVSIQIVGVDLSTFNVFYQLVVLNVAPIYHDDGGGCERVPVSFHVLGCESRRARVLSVRAWNVDLPKCTDFF
jgi:hypothetical protein